MPAVSFDVFTNIEQTTAAYSRGVEQIVRQAERLERAQRNVARAFEVVPGGGAGAAAQAAQQQVAQIERVTQARQREAQVTRQLEADRIRAARQQSRADAEALRARQRAERAALTALSTLGGENRALSQRIRFEQRLTQAVQQGVITQQRANQLRQQANVVFSTAAVNARDLRLNMLGLNQAVAVLSTRFGAFGPVALSALSGIQTAIKNARSEMEQFVAQSTLAARGFSGGGGQSAFGPFAAGTAVARPGFGTRALAAVGGPGGLAVGAAALGGTVALGGLVSVANDVEVAFDQLSAITGIAGEELESLRATAIELAAASTLGADGTEQLADAFRRVAAAAPELASTEQRLVDITRAAVLLSEASGDNLQDSVTTLTTALLQFGLQASDAQRVIDALAAGSNVGAVEIPQLGQVLAQTGRIAADAGLAIEDLVAVIEVAGRSGLPLETLQTSLRNILLTLQTTGRLGPGDNLADVLREIRDEGLSAAEMVELFERRNVTTASVLLANIDTLEQYQERVREAGAATEIADTRLGNLSAQADKAASSWGGFIRALAETGPIQQAESAVSSLIGAIDDVGRFLTSAVQGRGENLIAEQLGLDEIEENIEKLERLRDSFGGGGLVGRILGRQIAGFEAAREIAESRQPVFGPQLPEEPPGPSGEALAELEQRYQQLIRQYDRAAVKAEQYHDVENEIADLLRSGTIPSQDEANRLLALAREVIFGKTRVTNEAAAAEARYAEEIRKAAEAQEQARLASDERLDSLERENVIIAQQIDAYRQGPDAVAALNAELRVQEQIALRQREIGGPLTEQDVQRIRDAVLAGEDLRAELEAIQGVGKQTAQTVNAITRPIERASQEIQQSLAGAFRDAISSAEDFADALLDIMLDTAAQIAAALVFNPQIIGQGGALSGLGGLFGLIPSSAGTGSQADLVKATNALVSATNENTEATGQFVSVISQGTAGGGSDSGGFLASLLGGGGIGGGGILAALGASLGLIGTGIGKIGNPLGTGGSPATTLGAGIGGAIGLAAYGGIAASSLAATATGGAIGSTVGSVVPIVGTIIGLALGAAVGVLIDSLATRPRPSTASIVSSLDPNDPRFSTIAKLPEGANLLDVFLGRVDYDREILSRETPFGFIGLEGSTKSGLGSNTQFVQAVADFDFAVAEFLNRRQLEIVKEGILAQDRDFPVSANSFTETDFGKVLRNRIEDGLVALLESNPITAASTRGITNPGAASTPLEQVVFNFIGKNRNPEDLRRNIEGFVNSFNALTDGIDALRGETLTDAEQAVRNLEEQFSSLLPIAQAFGVEMSVIEDAFQQGLDTLRTDFEDDIRLSLLRLVDPLAAALEEQAEIAEERLRNAEALGVETVLLERLNAEERLRIIEDFAEQANSSLEALLRDLTASTASPLPTQTALANAQERLIETLAAVDAGDLDARNTLAQDFRSVLDLRSALFGNTAAFFEGEFGFNEITSELRRVIDTLPTAVSDAILGEAGLVPSLVGGGTGDGAAEVTVANVVRVEGVSTEAKQDDQVGEMQAIRKAVAEMADEIKRMRSENAALQSDLSRLLARVA